MDKKFTYSIAEPVDGKVYFSLKRFAGKVTLVADDGKSQWALIEFDPDTKRFRTISGVGSDAFDVNEETEEVIVESEKD